MTNQPPAGNQSCFDVESTAASRRAFLIAGVGALGSALLAGCSSGSKLASLPDPVWKEHTPPPRNYDYTPTYTPPAPSQPTPVVRQPKPTASPVHGVIGRTHWCKGHPVPMLMDRMSPSIRYVTIHHDGMSPFFAEDQRSAAGRLEAIRCGHRNRGWGDIGYHFAVDRGGRVWQCRPLEWQGAHVKDCNPGNIGVLCMGNFERQHPSDAQLEALRCFVGRLSQNYRLPMRRIRTHREWAATACPGKYLQPIVQRFRDNNQFA